VGVSAVRLEVADGREILPGWYVFSGRLPISASTPPVSILFSSDNSGSELGPVPLLSEGKVDENVVYRLPSTARVLTLAAESGAPILLHGQVDLKIRQLHRMEAWRRM